MSVAYLVAAFPKVSETFILGEVRELGRQGVDVTVFSLRPPKGGGPRHPGTDEVRTVQLPSGARGALAALHAVAATLAAHPARGARALSAAFGEPRGLVRFAQACWVSSRLPQDCTRLHAHFAHGPATAARLLSMLTGVPYSFTAHARDIFELASPRTLRRNVSRAAAVVAVSEHGRAHLASVVGADAARRIEVVRNGVDLDRFAPRAAEPPFPPVILAVARMVPKKGLDTLVDACALLDGPVRCRVVGDGPLRATLTARARRLGVDLDLAGSMDADGVVAAYGAAHVVALPCRRDRKGDQDGLPVSLVEAMAVGVPVVTTATAGIPELVEDGVSGVLVAPDDPAALAAALARVLRDPALRRDLAAGGRAVAETYERRIWVRRLRGVLGQPVEAAVPSA
jgi:glycosyltransferase involved in cell wall biosynthesis